MWIIDYLKPFAMGAMSAFLLGSVLFVPMLLVEVVRPARRLHWPTVLFNFLYLPVFLTLTAALAYPLIRYLTPWLPENLMGWDMSVMPVWLIGLLVVSYLAAFDFFYYWFHRLQHQWPVLWRFHRLHHADVNVSVSSSTRHHWMEEPLRFFVVAVPMLMLFGHPEHTFPWLGMSVGLYGLFIHWNVRLPMGPLERVLVGPEYHRLHHSIQERHYDKNFAVFFPFWDRLFGTQVLPEKGAEPVVTGLTDTAVPNGWRLLVPWPAVRDAPPLARPSEQRDGGNAGGHA